MTKQVGLPEEVINRFDKKYGVSKDDDLITTTRYSLLNDLAQAQQEVVKAWDKAEKHGTLPIPNKYGKTVRIERHNQVIKEMRGIFMKALQQEQE